MIPVLLYLAGTAEPTLLQNGQEAPPFSVRDLDRKMFSLSQHVGDAPQEPRKAMLMAFFATWCEPCKAELPILKRIRDRWSDKGVELVHVGLSQGDKELKPFVAEKGIDWRVLGDSFGLVSRRYGVTKLPHLFIVDAKGRIGFQHRGIAPNLEDLLEGEIARTLGIEVADAGRAEAAAVRRFSDTYALGRAPAQQNSLTRWEPLATFLGEQLAASVELQTEGSYESFEAALLAGKYALANAGPLLCHAARNIYEPVARIERQGTPAYLGILFATRQSGITKLAQLKGKSLGLVAESSTSGGLYPQKALLDAGLRPGQDVNIAWLGSHTKVAEAVQQGTVQAGGCFEDCRDAVWTNPVKKALETRILTYTKEIPSEMLLVKRSLDPALKARMVQAILALQGQEGMLKQISAGELEVTGVYPATDADLAPIAQVIGEVQAARKRPAEQ
jgi:phosphate/phosphite/phosphonate ABC transporter binding protein